MRHNCQPAPNGLALLDDNSRVGCFRDVQLDSGSELDYSEALAPLKDLVRCRGADNCPRQYPGDLPHRSDRMALRRMYQHDPRRFVHLGGLGIKGVDVIPGLVHY